MILVDLNSLGFAATAGKKLTAGLLETGGVFGVIQRLREIREDYAGKMICLHDGRSWRYNEFPEYKGNRALNPKLVILKDRWKLQRPIVARILRTMGVAQVVAGNMEADDLAARICRNTPHPVTLITGDKDWLQLVDNKTIWVDLTHKRRASVHNFVDIAEFKTSWDFVQAKALTGDAGDNVPGVGGIGPTGAKWILDSYGSVESFLTKVRSDPDEFSRLPKKYRVFAEGAEGEERFNRNLRLVWLNHPAIPEAKDKVWSTPHVQRDKFIDLCGELAFHSILREPDKWLRPFTTNTSET
jgi:DNA polymerase-1